VNVNLNLEDLLVVAVVSPPLVQELLVCALLHDDPAVHKHDVVGLLHRLQLMGHHQQGDVRGQQLPRHLTHTHTHTVITCVL